MSAFRTKRLVITGMLTALAVVLSRFLSIPTPVVKYSFDFVPIVLVAMLYGPLWSGVAYAASDFIGATLFPTGAYFFGFTLTAFIAGVAFGLCLYKRSSPKLAALAAFSVCCLIQFPLDTLWLTMIIGKGFAALAPVRLTKAAIMTAVETTVIILIQKRFLGRLLKNVKE